MWEPPGRKEWDVRPFRKGKTARGEPPGALQQRQLIRARPVMLSEAPAIMPDFPAHARLPSRADFRGSQGNVPAGWGGAACKGVTHTHQGRGSPPSQATAVHSFPNRTRLSCSPESPIYDPCGGVLYSPQKNKRLI